MATCRTCVYLRKCIEKATKEGYEHNVDFDASSGCPNFGFKSNTNADRIRAMTDDEMADWLARTQIDNVASALKIAGVQWEEYPDMKDEVKKDALEWLKQPAEGE